MPTTKRISKHITVVLNNMDEATEREFTDAFTAEGLTGYVAPPPRQLKIGKYDT